MGQSSNCSYSPSLWAVNERGWDAHLPTNGTDFYYQFKLSDYMVRPTATYWRDGTYHGPYFRVRLHKHDLNKQHCNLRALSATFPETYYVAPETDSMAIFNQAFLTGTMTDHSRMISLAECDDVNDGAQHYITYQAGIPPGCFTQRRRATRNRCPGSGWLSTTRGPDNDGNE